MEKHWWLAMINHEERKIQMGRSCVGVVEGKDI